MRKNSTIAPSYISSQQPFSRLPPDSTSCRSPPASLYVIFRSNYNNTRYRPPVSILWSALCFLPPEAVTPPEPALFHLPLQSHLPVSLLSVLCLLSLPKHGPVSYRLKEKQAAQGRLLWQNFSFCLLFSSCLTPSCVRCHPPMHLIIANSPYTCKIFLFSEITNSGSACMHHRYCFFMINIFSSWKGQTAAAWETAPDVLPAYQTSAQT